MDLWSMHLNQAADIMTNWIKISELINLAAILCIRRTTFYSYTLFLLIMFLDLKYRLENKTQFKSCLSLTLCIEIIMFPQRPQFVLPSHIPNSKLQILVFYCFNIKT